MELTQYGQLEPVRDLDKLAEEFGAYIDASQKTVEVYLAGVRHFLQWLHANEIQNPTRADVIRYKNYLVENYSASTASGRLTAVRQFYNFLATEKGFPNVADHIKTPTPSRDSKRDHLTGEQIENVLNQPDIKTIKGKRDYALLLLMATGGLRDIEVSRANVEDLTTRGGHPVLYLQGKGRAEKGEFMNLRPETAEALQDYLQARKTPRNGKNLPLFESLGHNSKGERLTTRSISRIVKNALISAGYQSDRLTAHSLRHSAVTIALQDGATLQQAQQFARHRNIATTLIYAHNLDREENPCEDIIEKAIFKNKKARKNTK